MKYNKSASKLPFINREKEQKILMEYFQNIPKNILFLYGPKSTGKTTLIKKVINTLDAEKYAVSFFNMRETLVHNYTDFTELFFPRKFKNTVKNLVSGIHLNLGFASLNVEDEALYSEDIFSLLMDKITKANEEGIKPVIILDEFQYLQKIKLYKDNDDIYLIEELFKFFIALTKQNNLAHVVCLTSDSYYMEELYNDTKLSNTSDFQLIDHLSKEDIYGWLEKKEECPKEMVDDIWGNLGGSVWEIWQVFVSYKNTGEWKPKLNDLLQVKYSYLAEYYAETIPDEWVDQFEKITKELVQNGMYTIGIREKAMHLVEPLVSKDLWFFDTKTRTITPNSKSIQKGMERLVKEM